MKMIRSIVRFSTKLPFVGKYIHYAVLFYVRLRDASPSLAELAPMIAKVAQLEQIVGHLSSQLSDFEKLFIQSSLPSQFTKLEQAFAELSQQVAELAAEGKNLSLSTPIALRNLRRDLTQVSNQLQSLQPEKNLCQVE